jgi:hypothetical protein
MTDPFAAEINLDTAAAAKRLGVSESFLAKARMRGTGPRYSKFGRAVRYTPANLDRYQRERSRTSTAEEPTVTGLVRRGPVEPECQKKAPVAVSDQTAPSTRGIRRNVHRLGRRNKRTIQR